MRPNKLNDVLSAKTVILDGLITDFLFEKRMGTALQESKKNVENHGLHGLEDFAYEEVKSVYKFVFIDLDEKPYSLLQLARETRNHQIRQCSTKDYYNLIWSTEYSSRVQISKTIEGLTSIEANISTQNTCSPILYGKDAQRLAFLYIIQGNNETIKKNQKHSFSYIHFTANADVAFADWLWLSSTRLIFK